MRKVERVMEEVGRLGHGERRVAVVTLCGGRERGGGLRARERRKNLKNLYHAGL